VVFARVGRGDLGVAWALVLALIATAPLAVLWRWPSIAVGLVVGGNVAFATTAPVSWPLAGLAAWLLVMGVSPLLLPRARAVGLLVFSVACVMVPILLPVSLDPARWPASIAQALALALAWTAGERLRARRAVAVRAAEVATQLQGLREREAVARGRAGIARELHDVVAHHVSLIAVRAAMAPYQLTDLSLGAEQAFGEIAAEARSALEELRTVLGVLRTPGGEPPQPPQPTLSDLPDLVDRMQASGMDVIVETTGVPRMLPAAVGLCCYRLAQEALTNAARHAPGAAVRLSLVHREAAVQLAVSDSGRPDRRVAASAVPGFGLIGMRERVTTLGGDFQAGPDGRGFRVSARIPTVVPDRTPG
jgi:signal transduction histidine kinase